MLLVCSRSQGVEDTLFLASRWGRSTRGRRVSFGLNQVLEGGAVKKDFSFAGSSCVLTG